MNIHRRLMIFLTALVFGGLVGWSKNAWREADRNERKWVVGLAVCAVGAATVGALRALGAL